MTCPICGHGNPAGSKFCLECGSRLASRCPSCGVELPPTAKFCNECGSARSARSLASDAAHARPAASSSDRAEARKVVTIVFADLIGSTSLHERLDPESVSRVMERYHRAVRAPVEAHGGTVVQLLGDGVMCAFGVPRVAEDDAICAVRAAVGIQQAFREFAREHAALLGHVGLRVAVNTGEVVVSDDYAAGIGDPLNVAARLQQEARDGDVLVGEATERLVRERVTLEPVGTFTLKGRSETVTAYRVVSLDRPTGIPATAFVGRDDELRHITAVYEAAIAGHAARLAVILGSPGLGKSRLLDEFGRRLGDRATVLRVHCEAAGGATFAPIAKALHAFMRIDEIGTERAAGLPGTPFETPPKEGGSSGRAGRSSPASEPDESGTARAEALEARGGVLRQPANDDSLRAIINATLPGNDTDRDRITGGIAALLAATPALPEETFFVIRRFLAALAAMQPVVLTIDDLQWAEPLLLDLIEHLVQWGSGVPLLVLAAARPDLRDRRSSLATPGGFVSDVVTLAGLDAGAATRLAADVIGAAELPAAVAGRVLATSEGNPLFVSELVRMLVNDGALKRVGDRWTAAVDLAALEMPPTIHALLAARIERLRAEDRLVLERAAIVGRQFSRAAVAHLLPREVTDLDARLEALRRSELIEPDASWFLGEPALRFHHGLTRDAAYRRVLKGTRAELHGRCAEWIEGRVGETVEHDEMIGWHLEQAHQHLRELGPIDERGRTLGERAARYLAAAGRRALARDDLPVAANLLGRAIDRLEAADPTRADLALDWCEALLAAGEVGPAEKAIAELGRWIGATSAAASAQAFDASSKGSSPSGRGQVRGSDILFSRPSSPGGELKERGAEELISSPHPDLFPEGEGTPAPSGVCHREPRLRAWHTCFTGQLAVLTDPQALHATADAVAAAADELASCGDTAGEAKAHLVHALALSRLGKFAASEAELDKALAAARRAHDRRRSNTVLANAPLAALWGPSPVTRASGRCLDVVRVLRITQGAPAVEAVALRCQAVLEALRGRAEAARRMIASSRRMVEELGVTQGLLETEMFAGLIELIEGDTAAAEHSLRGAYDGLRNHGLGIDAARAAALLGIALLAQDRAAEAEGLSHESEALAGDDLQAAITWRRVRAEALLWRGEHAAAVDLARAAVDIAAATDALIHHADARLALAAALRAGGRHDEAAAEEARAIELWEAKGATVLADRTRSGAGRIVERDRAPGDRAAAAPPAHRRVVANDATANAARLVAAIAAGNADAISTLLADNLTVVHHPTGVDYDREGLLVSVRSHLRAREPTYGLEPLTTLGTSLALFRQTVSSLPRDELDIGAAERVGITLMEVDAQGRNRHTEYFAADRLGDAVGRLYECYAELLPEGPERIRAAATARSVAALAGPIDLDRWATAIARGVETADHRTLGIGSARGADAFLRGLGSLLEVADDVANRTDDILDLRPDALLVRRTNFGIARVGGGAYERRFLVVWAFGADGLLARLEQFDLGHEAEALARFDELAPSISATREGEPPGEPRVARGGSAGALRPFDVAQGSGQASPSQAARPSRAEPPTRRVRANAATAHAARTDAAMAARDADALPTLAADRVEVMDHMTGVTFDRQGLLASWRSLLRAQNPTHRHEVLFTLGDSLALCRLSTSASAYAGRKLDVGAYEREEIVLIEVDAEGRRRRSESFATDRLADAVARLYQRYADLLPGGSERARAAARAGSVAALLGPAGSREERLRDPGRSLFAPDVEATDHRTVGFGSLRGADAVLRAIQSLRQLSDDFDDRFGDVLDLRSDALLMRWTTSGTIRASGGAFAQDLCMLWIFGADGLATRWEQFDAEQEAEALARFDELAMSPDEGRKVAAPSRAAERPLRRVRPNAATTNAARTDAAIAARDAGALADVFGERTGWIDHTTGTEYDRPGVLATWRSLLRAENPTHRHEVLATLGDSLALCRNSTSASGYAGRKLDVGAYDREEILLIEVDAQGRRRWSESFAADHLGDAVARLYQRYADLFPDGPERARAAATAGSVATVQGFNLDRFGAHVAPDIEFIDHRALGFPSTKGAEVYLRRLASLLEVADDVATRIDDVLGLQTDALLVSWTTFGIDRAGGGAFERPFLILWVFGPDGLVTRNEMFDANRGAEALGRFNELRPDPPSAGLRRTGPLRTPPNAATRAFEKRARRVRANAATASAARLDAAIADRDADAIADLVVDDAKGVEHPTGTEYDRPGLIFSYRILLSAQAPACRHEPLATLGDSLSLCRLSTSASGFTGGNFDVGAYEREGILLIEVDAEGRCRWTELFGVDRLGDAVARLYDRYAELLPDGPARDRASATASSVAALLGPADRWLFAPDAEATDHRTVGFGSLRGADAIVTAVRALLELTADWAIRSDDILALRPDALVMRRTNFGTDHYGGAFERDLCHLWIFGADGLATRWEQFDAEQESEALARFDELVRSNPSESPLRKGRTEERSPPARIENAATRAVDCLRDASATGDWGRFAALFPPGFRIIERRRMVQLEIDRDQYLDAFRPLFEMTSSTPPDEVLATRGDRLALLRSLWIGADSESGPSEVEWLTIMEVDERGEPTAAITFDPDDLDAAYAELDERYAAGEAAAFAAVTTGARAFAAAVAARDWDALATVLAPDLVVHDHRPLGWETLRGPPMLVDTWKSLVELAPDARLRIDHVTVSANGSLALLTLLGTHEGGDFEDTRVVVHEYDASGKIRRHDIYNLDQLDEARARFAAIAASSQAERADAALDIPLPSGAEGLAISGRDIEGSPPAAARDPPSAGLRRTGPLAALAKSNAAIAATDRVEAAFAVRDWAAMRAAYAPDAKIEDRRRHVLLAGDVDGWIADRQRAARAGVVYQRRLGASVERVALERVSCTGAPGGEPSATEYLWLTDVDESGRIAFAAAFDVDDRRVAIREILARVIAGDPQAATSLGPIFEITDAFEDYDLARSRAVLADDVVVEDHRRAGMGRIEGANAYVDSLAALWKLAPRLELDAAVMLARERHGAVAVQHNVGTLAEGGGTFENYIVSVAIVEHGRITRSELFELEDVEAALARFAELRPDPLRIPPNAATRAFERRVHAARAGDWEAHEAVCAPTLVWDDRRPLVRTTGDRDLLIANDRHVFSRGAQLAHRVLATAGDRLALQHHRWTAADNRAPFEIGALGLIEVDAEGRIVAIISFDPDDRRAASAEMIERYARSDEAQCIPATFFEAFRAYSAHDLERHGAALSDDFVLNDHRRTGLGRLEGVGDQVASVAALFELAPDEMLEPLYIIAAERHGVLAMAHASGTLAHGGEFESVFLVLALFQDCWFVRLELFEPEDLDGARARFEELRGNTR